MRLRVATLNTWGLPGRLARDTEVRARAIGFQLDRLELDLVAFQEVWTESSREILVGAGQRCGLQQVWHRQRVFAGSGLLVLSRLPIRHASFHAFSLNGRPERIQHADYWGGKGFAELEISTPEGPFTFITTHLHARYGSLDPPKDEDQDQDEYLAHRTSQVVELAEAVDRLHDSVIAVGDFNFEEGDPEYAILSGLTGLRDGAAELDRRKPTVVSDGAYRSLEAPSARIDYVLARAGRATQLRYLQIERIFEDAAADGHPVAAYSDHFGLLAELEMSAGPSPCTRPSLHAVARAERLLHEGLLEAEQRRSRERRVSAGFALVAASTLGAGHRMRGTRRRVLRNLFSAAGLVSGFAAAGWLALAEVALPQELRGFLRCRASLERLRSRATREC